MLESKLTRINKNNKNQFFQDFNDYASINQELSSLMQKNTEENNINKESPKDSNHVQSKTLKKQDFDYKNYEETQEKTPSFYIKENEDLKIKQKTLLKDLESLKDLIKPGPNSSEQLGLLEAKLKIYKTTEEQTINESLQCSDMLEKSEQAKRIKDEKIKDLEKEIFFLEENNRFFVFEKEKIETQLSKTLEVLNKERKKVTLSDSKLEELHFLKEANEQLSETVKKLQNSNEISNQINKDLQETFVSFREKSEENEIYLKALIETLSEQVNKEPFSPIGLQEKSKFKRTNTNLSLQNISKENYYRLRIKKASLEEELYNAKEEIEKLKKNLAYNSKIIEDKNQIIIQIEKNIKNDVEKQFSEIKTKLLSDLGGFLQSLEKNILEVLKILKCKLCKDLESQKFLSTSSDIVCENCISSPNSAKLIRLNFMTVISSHLSTQYSHIMILKSLLTNN